MTEWVDLTHPETGGTVSVLDEPGVVETFEARGWTVAGQAAESEPVEPAKEASEKNASAASAADDETKE